MAASGPKSKKPSGASLNSPPEPLVFFVDRSLGRKIIPEALRHAGEEVRIHDEHFPQNAKDEVWLTEVGQRGWIVLTKDTHIRYRATESAALLAAGLGLLARQMKRERPGSINDQGYPALARLGIRNAGRNPGRSLLTAGLLAAAAFLVISVQSFRKSATDETSKQSGTGGFTLIAEAGGGATKPKWSGQAPARGAIAAVGGPGPDGQGLKLIRQAFRTARGPPLTCNGADHLGRPQPA